MRKFSQLISGIATSDVPILLLGENGVGKSFAAQQIHQASAWREFPFLECDCRVADEASIRAAFEQAAQSPAGRATIYLDQIEQLSHNAQKTLFLLLTSAETNQPNVIASASSDLEMEVRSGRFREDLFYKLCGICLPIAPLRYRKDEIGTLADSYLDKYARQYSLPKPKLSAQLERYLHSHPWTGNLRELEEAMRTIVAAGNVSVAIAALQSSLPGNKREKSPRGGSRSLKQVARAASHRAERDLILKVLAKTKWNRKKAAAELKISYKALLYKLKEIGADPAVTGRKGSN